MDREDDHQIQLSDALHRVGIFGRFQFILLILYSLVMFLFGMITSQFRSLSVTQDIACVTELCSRSREPASGWFCGLSKQDWKFSFVKRNWLTDFDLFCDREYFRDSESSIYFTGMFFTVLVVGFCSDKYGRRVVSIGSLSGVTVLVFILKYVDTFNKVMLVRCISGAFHGGAAVSLLVLVMEFTLQQTLWFCVMFGSISYNIGEVVMVLMAYERDEWQSTLDLPICVAIAAFVLLYFVIPESPYWFYSSGKELLALVAMNEVAIINRSLPRLRGVKLVAGKSQEDPGVNTTCTSVLRDKMIRRTLAGLTVCVFTVFTSHYILKYEVDWNGMDYTTMGIYALSGIPCKIILLFAGQKVGRARLTVIFLVVLISIYLVAILPHSILPFEIMGISLKTMLLFLGHGVSGSMIPMLLIYICEVVPTASRASCLGLCLMMSTVGVFLSPFLAALNSLSSFTDYVFTILFAVASVILCRGLPETLGHPLSVNVEDVLGLFNNRCSLNRGNRGAEFEMQNLLSQENDEDDDIIY